jgi:triosephosphate isomerase (TIM)
MSCFLGLNWKLNPSTLSEAQNLLASYGEFEDLVVFAPSVFLQPLTMVNLDLNLGSQDISENETGAFTGEISPLALNDLGVKYTLVGHSETRQNLGYDNQKVANKTKNSLKNNLTPIVCLGYSLDKEGVNYDELQEQIHSVLVENSSCELFFAYEPVWAIGTGKAASSEIVAQVLDFLHKYITDNFPKVKAKLLYGGSVNSLNFLELAKTPYLDGFLIGSSSLKPDEVEAFFKLRKEINHI